MCTKKVIGETLKETLISLVDHNEYLKLKLGHAIDVINFGHAHILTPYELFLLGKELGHALTIQSECTSLEVNEHEIILAIDEVETLLKNLT